MNDAAEYERNKRLILEVLPLLRESDLVWLARRIGDELDRRTRAGDLSL